LINIPLQGSKVGENALNDKIEPTDNKLNTLGTNQVNKNDSVLSSAASPGNCKQYYADH
jgi:hypothetical protein